MSVECVEVVGGLSDVGRTTTCGVVVLVFRGLRVSLLRCLSDAQDDGRTTWNLTRWIGNSFRSGLVQHDQSP